MKNIILALIISITLLLSCSQREPCTPGRCLETWDLCNTKIPHKIIDENNETKITKIEIYRSEYADVFWDYTSVCRQMQKVSEVEAAEKDSKYFCNNNPNVDRQMTRQVLSDAYCDTTFEDQTDPRKIHPNYYKGWQDIPHVDKR